MIVLARSRHMPGALTTLSAISSSIYISGTIGLSNIWASAKRDGIELHHFRTLGLSILNKCANRFLHTDNGQISMDHIARYDRLQRIVAEAAQFRTLREVVKSDPQITPHTAALLRGAFNIDIDDLLKEAAHA